MRRRHLSPQEIEPLVVVSIVAILIAVLLPAIDFRVKTGRCQSNMNQIGKALKMYLADYDDTYPVNGSRNKYAPMVRLSDLSKTDGRDILKIRFKYGVNWVEALWPYVEKVSEGNVASVWKCPAARPYGSEGFVTYAFNANLAGQPGGIIRSADTLMAVRELGCIDHAVLRPTAPSPSAKAPPDDAFLDAFETTPDARYKLHRRGSNILFADGHVKRFGTAYFPKSCQWDAKDNQWYNYTKLPARDPRNKSIAVSP